MRARALAIVLLRVWAVVVVMQIAMKVPQMVAFLFPQSLSGVDTSMFKFVGVSQVVASVVYAALAIAVFVHAQRIAAFIVADDGVELGDMAGLQAVAFGTLGAYFLVLGLREMAGLAYQLVNRPQYETERLAYLWRNVPLNLIQAAVQTICGFALLVGRSGASRLVNLIRGKTAADE